MRLAICGWLVFFGLGSMALAQDITLPMDRIGAGSYLVFAGEGRSLVHVFRGRSGKHWVVDVVEGADPNGPRLSREYRDAAGQAVRIEFENGMVISYAPHDCQRTLGPCLYLQTTEPGDTTRRGRITTATHDGYSYTQSLIPDRGDAIPLASGVMLLDATGAYVEGRITAQDGSVTVMRLVQAVYR